MSNSGQAGQVVATLTRLFGPRHLGLAENVVQETLIKALRQWSYRGVPDNPAGWMMTVARNQALDILRRERHFRDKQAALVAPTEERNNDPAATGERNADSRPEKRRLFQVEPLQHLRVPDRAGAVAGKNGGDLIGGTAATLAVRPLAQRGDVRRDDHVRHRQ